ncbi:MAG: molybdenum cofactor biosynthesis protein MoaE [bacterium]|nr:molybdenum cofactor biosynthesis protein MoaE [bacterium]MDE0667464.1 molybdenum cofactor biosynthesis protein MoaE [bacterium]
MRSPKGDTWVGLCADRLPLEAAVAWANRRDCGAVVMFSGNARDSSADRAGVYELTYEAYEAEAENRLAAVARQARDLWPAVGRLALLHRTGTLAIGDAAVVVVAAAPHRAEAFSAARFCIDALKATVPIWKLEKWAGGESWGREAQHLSEIEEYTERAHNPL